MRQTVIMLDLENTIISSWNGRHVLDYKVLKIRKQINSLELKNPVFGIFSTAIDNVPEKDIGFNIVKRIMDVDVDCNFIPCFDELKDLVCNDHLQKWEIMQLFGKEGLFDLYTKDFPDYDFVLFDDMLDYDFKTITRQINNKETIQTVKFFKV